MLVLNILRTEICTLNSSRHHRDNRICEIIVFVVWSCLFIFLKSSNFCVFQNYEPRFSGKMSVSNSFISGVFCCEISSQGGTVRPLLPYNKVDENIDGPRVLGSSEINRLVQKD